MDPGKYIIEFLFNFSILISYFIILIDNFDYICWETIQDNNTNKKKLKSDKESIASLSYSEFESSGFECLFKLCSCGESKKSNDGLCSIENSIKKCNICKLFYLSF